MEHVSQDQLQLELAALRADLRAEMATLRGDLTTTLERELRAQTWRMATALLATVTVITALLRVT